MKILLCDVFFSGSREGVDKIWEAKPCLRNVNIVIFYCITLICVFPSLLNDLRNGSYTSAISHRTVRYSFQLVHKKKPPQFFIWMFQGHGHSTVMLIKSIGADFTSDVFIPLNSNTFSNWTKMCHVPSAKTHQLPRLRAKLTNSLGKFDSHVIRSCSLNPRQIYEPAGVKQTISSQFSLILSWEV